MSYRTNDKSPEKITPYQRTYNVLKSKVRFLLNSVVIGTFFGGLGFGLYKWTARLDQEATLQQKAEENARERYVKDCEQFANAPVPGRCIEYWANKR